ncbi:glycosyltransferase family 2 protein [Frankia sp. AgB1.9]|uniref:dolichyl-phosphate beta-glucosyltransferase n=1 Tax=unclassified Frankia TaxID=2632575 RepID=UPI001933848C|nr:MULTISPECIES: dolichyl-phosphate beta-glucosyltransferase [unclassified Frankia]MBL7489086.1 glycosyltransferase family 2 protein [Frankia sp. AgW1.1]MBL7547904.1 glycosyltransferase family 2 protein [Frankia sp. AgB1.9]MBL7621372.1 glycosyltransferase family 2 protein [Frankia sp. AgB1.8]
MRRVPVSVVVPAFNESRRLPFSLPVLVAALREFPGAEVIVVDDGSSDDTAAIATRLLRDLPTGRVIRLPWNSGKGTAIRAGVAAATGEAIVFTDADLASDVSDLPLLLAALSDAEVAIGSRRVGAGATRPYVRQLGSWAFNQLTRSFTAIDLADTQCGFKAFRRDEAKVLFSMARATGFGFDVEVLAMATAMEYRIVEVPVRWSEEPGGTFSVIRHTPSMIVDLARARRYLRQAGRPIPLRAAEPSGTGPGTGERSVDPAAGADVIPLDRGHPQPAPVSLGNPLRSAAEGVARARPSTSG